VLWLKLVRMNRVSSAHAVRLTARTWGAPYEWTELDQSDYYLQVYHPRTNNLQLTRLPISVVLQREYDKATIFCSKRRLKQIIHTYLIQGRVQNTFFRLHIQALV